MQQQEHQSNPVTLTLNCVGLLGKLRKMCIVLNPRRKHMQTRVSGLTIYYPTEKASLVYNKVELLSNPVVLIRFGLPHYTFSEQQSHNLVFELRNNGRIRGITYASVYPFFSRFETSFKYSKYYGIVELQAPLLLVYANTMLVNTFETGIPVVTQEIGDRKWT